MFIKMDDLEEGVEQRERTGLTSLAFPERKQQVPPAVRGGTCCLEDSAYAVWATKRWRMAATWARVAWPWGARVPSPMPEMRPFSTAQAMAA